MTAHSLVISLDCAVKTPTITWTALVAQMIKNPPAMREIWVRCLDWEDALEKGKATHSSILAWRIPWTEGPGRLHTVHGVSKSWTRLSN